MSNKHVLLVTFPGQGHINPALQFAKRLAKHGLHVTFLTSHSAIRRIPPPPPSSSIEFLSISDGYDGGWSNDDLHDFVPQLRDHGSRAMEVAILARRQQGRPFARVIYTLLVPWAGHVARRLLLPATLLWIQPASVFALYFYYFNKFIDFAATCKNRGVINLPGLPEMEPRDLPSFFLDSSPNIYDFALPTFIENFAILDAEEDPTIFLNTFDELETEALRITSKYKMLAIGPLVPSAFLDGRDPSDKSFGGDLIQKTEDYSPWLDSKEKSSVIYVAFGSYSEISKVQMEEIAAGLIGTGRPFLWVIRKSKTGDKIDLSNTEELEKQGKIVNWCDQVEVLSNPSVGCFVTHCGWNSTLESLVSGVPLVMLPQWSDQATNAKLVQDLWRTGVRAKGGDGGVVGRDEIGRCVEIVMEGGGRGVEMRKEGKKWRDLAKEAMKEDGSSNLNLKNFVDQLVGGHE